MKTDNAKQRKALVKEYDAAVCEWEAEERGKRARAATGRLKPGTLEALNEARAAKWQRLERARILLLSFDTGRAEQKRPCPGLPAARASAAPTREPKPKAVSATNPHMICPHCQTRGSVVTRPTKVKQGISGGKATGAILTGGLSLVAVGLSRKQRVTAATCTQCGSSWVF